MSLSKETKLTLMNEYRQHDTDTGSTEVQVSLLTHDIKTLTEHFKQHPKDFHSRQGLQAKVNRRRSLLKHMKIQDDQRYYHLIQRLSLRDSY